MLNLFYLKPWHLGKYKNVIENPNVSPFDGETKYRVFIYLCFIVNNVSEYIKLRTTPSGLADILGKTMQCIFPYIHTEVR